MAVGGKDATPSLDLFECQVCLEPMAERQPRTLSACNHTFCQLCLEQLVDRLSNNITCPTCRKMTDVPKGDVTQLPRNFSLAKMKEWQQHLLKEKENSNPKENDAGGQMCDVCCHEGSSNKATSKCNECSIHLCTTCKGIHLSTPAFGRHSFTNLIVENLSSSPTQCDIHAKPVELVCLECQKGICLLCSFNAIHQLHKEKILPLKEGLSKVAESAQRQHELIQRDLKELDDFMQDSSKDLICIDTVLQELSLKEKEIQTKVSKVSSVYRNPILKIMEKLQVAKGKYVRSLEETEQNQDLDYFVRESKILEDIKDARELAQGAYTEYKHLPKINQNVCAATENSLPQQIYNSNIASTSLTKEEKSTLDFSSPRFILKVRPGITIIDRPTELLQLDNNNVIVNDGNLGFLQQLDMDGYLVSRIYPHGIGSSIGGVAVHADVLYFANNKGITQVPLALNRGERSKCSSIKDVLGLAAINENTLLLSTKKGDIYELDLATESRKLILSGLNKPYYFCIKHLDNDYRYFITETDPDNGRIITKKDNGIGFKVLMGGLKNPGSCCLTENQTMLVSEQDGNRVFEMTLDGRFIRNILTKREHKIRDPSAISLRYPYLWMCELHGEKGGAIKLFKFE